MRPGAFLFHGDARRLPLADASVQCVVTSPPYWGLRDYGLVLSIWGGKQDCRHAWQGQERKGISGGLNAWSADKYLGRDGASIVPLTEQAWCPCGAWRGVLGLEPTPEQYVQHLVEIFREVRRVLRGDGTCWVNLGSSYASGDMRPTPIPDDARAPAYGSDGRARPDSRGPDSVYRGLCDGCRVVLASDRIVDISRRDGRLSSLGELRGRDSELSDSGEALLAASVRVGQASTTCESVPRPPGACSHCANCGACLAVLRSSSRDASRCARMAPYTSDTAWPASASRNRGMDASGTAWLKYTFKPKDMVPIPWMVAMALQADGWYLRCDVIWAKPNPMPESITDRPTKSHEYLFLLTKAARYYYDGEAIREPAEYGYRTNNGPPMTGRIAQSSTMWRSAGSRTVAVERGAGTTSGKNPETGRNRRSVWTIATEPYPEAHFATFPEKLVEPCILAGTRPGERVLDPFAGSGTTVAVAERLGRVGIGVELKPAYLTLARQRTMQMGLL